VYRISGYRGTVREVDFQIAEGAFVRYGKGTNLGVTLANYSLDDVRIGDDSSFEVVLSTQRPPGHDGDWWPLDPRATYLMVRQMCTDWSAEVDARLAIERLDTPAIKPRPSAEEIAANLGHLAGRAEGYVRASMSFVEQLRARGVINALAPIDYGDDGGVLTQRYALGLFDLAPDEALVVECEVPRRCRYWSIQLADELFAAVDWMNRQSSINDHTATLDADGKFRAVICCDDPGVPNWLDTGGYRRGLIQARWQEPSDWSSPTVTKVRTSAVRSYLPADTPEVSPAQRDEAIRRRRQGAQLRRRW
jgi:hypothetical protein